MTNINYIYTGVFFDKNEFFNKFNCNIGEKTLERKIKNPHVTFTYRPTEINPALFGEPVKFNVIGYACDGKNQGLQVEVVAIHNLLKAEYSKIKNPHITVSVSSDGKPVDTGNMVFNKINNPFFVIGKYGAYKKY